MIRINYFCIYLYVLLTCVNVFGSNLDEVSKLTSIPKSLYEACLNIAIDVNMNNRMISEEELGNKFRNLNSEIEIKSMSSHQFWNPQNLSTEIGWILTLSNNFTIGIKGRKTESIHQTKIEKIIFAQGVEDEAKFFEFYWWEGMDPKWKEFKIITIFNELYNLTDLNEIAMGAIEFSGLSMGQGRIIARFRNNRSPQVSIRYENPSQKSLEEIYFDPQLLPANVSLEELKRISTDPARAAVAVFDTGVDYNHPALAYKLVKIGWDFLAKDSWPYDVGNSEVESGGPSSHGTAVAAIAAGEGKYTAVLPVRIIGASDNGLEDFNSMPVRFQKAVEFARLHGARVINMSYGNVIFPNDREEVRQRKIRVFEELTEIMKNNSDILFVLAAGNAEEMKKNLVNADEIFANLRGLPVQLNTKIKLPNVLKVGAVDGNHELLSKTLYGSSSVELAAVVPSGSIPFEGGTYRSNIKGSSFAAPVVSHAAAYVISQLPGVSVAKIVEILRQATIQTSTLKDKFVWGGYLDAEELKRNVEKIKSLNSGK